MFLSRTKKNNVYPVNPSFTKQKWGLWGSKLYRNVFVMKQFITYKICSYISENMQFITCKICSSISRKQVIYHMQIMQFFICGIQSDQNKCMAQRNIIIQWKDFTGSMCVYHSDGTLQTIHSKQYEGKQAPDQLHIHKAWSDPFLPDYRITVNLRYNDSICSQRRCH